MADMRALQEFVEPYYAGKDIMHNMWHIELVQRAVEKIIAAGRYKVDQECLTLAVYFHGFIYSAEGAVREWMRDWQYPEETVGKTVKIISYRSSYRSGQEYQNGYTESWRCN